MESQQALLQEESDAALARRLHEEINGPAVSQQTPESISSPSPAAKTIECPSCTFINTFAEFSPAHNYACQQCLTVLHAVEPEGNRNAPTTNQRTVKCACCQCLNRIPQGKFDAIVCGGCCNELKTETSDSGAPHSQPASAATRTLQVRCGECSGVNALQVNMNMSNVRFECGSCQTINEVSL